MKNRNIIITSLSAIALFVSMSLTSCKGPAGTDGIAGANGKDANSSCLVCHNTSNMNSKKLSINFQSTLPEQQVQETENTAHVATQTKVSKKLHKTETLS